MRRLGLDHLGWKRLVAMVVALVALVVVVRALTDGPRIDPGVASENIRPGSPAVLRSTIDGFDGKPVVVNYWATWCVPCETEMPYIVEAYERYDDRVAFLGVNVQDDHAAAAKFATRYGMTFESLYDPDREIVRAQKLLGLPATQFYDAEGELAFVKQGEISEDELIEKIEEVLRASR